MDTSKLMPDLSHSSSLKKLGFFRHPVTALGTFDLHWKDWNMHSREHDDDYSYLFCVGRSRWKSFLNSLASPSDEKSLSLLVDHANTLLGNGNTGLSMPNGKSFSSIAFLLCRFGFKETSEMAEKLAKSSLASVMGISEDRAIVQSLYLSEPLLAEAAARYSQAKPENRQEILNDFERALENELIDPPRGDVGEMCAVALLGMAMDVLRVDDAEELTMSCPISLTHFLKRLGSKLVDVVEKQFSDWHVNFTHFVRIPCDPTDAMLVFMWKRRLAFYMREGGGGGGGGVLDLLIAIRSNNQDKFGTLRVQVKNYKERITDAARGKIMTRLLPSKCATKSRHWICQCVCCFVWEVLKTFASLPKRTAILSTEKGRARERKRLIQSVPNKYYNLQHHFWTR